MTTVINFKTDKKIKTQAQKIAEEMGLNLSDVLNIYLRRFVVKKELHISLNEDESNPSDELLEAIKEAKEEYKSGKMKSFKNMDSFIAHLKQI
ncbi:MAG: type II toxin-antitoxin system RelB/DinJ family antitoxin [Patescibacteria group bacterium]|nr:type II toxin-antitoxin system RelB/DinJ family antitoxin [Patescibacteria group bacterium]